MCKLGRGGGQAREARTRQTLKLLPLLSAAVLSLGMVCIATTFGVWKNYHHCEEGGPHRFYVEAPFSATLRRHGEQVGKVFVTCEVTERGVKPGFQIVFGEFADFVEEPGSERFSLEVSQPPREHVRYSARGGDGVYAVDESEAWALITLMASRRRGALRVNVKPENGLSDQSDGFGVIEVNRRGFRKALVDLRKRDCSLIRNDF